MTLRLFFPVHNETYLWWILRVFCVFYDWSYFQDVAPLLNQAKKYCLQGIWKWVIFKAQTLYPDGEEDIQRIVNQNAFTTLFCQLSQPNLKQHRLPLTSQRSQQWLAAGGHQGCCWGKDWGESVLPDTDCQDFLQNSVWWVTCEMKTLCGTSFPGYAKFQVEHPALLITTWQLFSALRCKCKWHISRG